MSTASKKVFHKQARHNMYTIFVTGIVIAGFLYLLYLRGSGIIEAIYRQLH